MFTERYGLIPDVQEIGFVFTGWKVTQGCGINEFNYCSVFVGGSKEIEQILKISRQKRHRMLTTVTADVHFISYSVQRFIGLVFPLGDCALWIKFPPLSSVSFRPVLRQYLNGRHCFILHLLPDFTTHGNTIPFNS